MANRFRKPPLMFRRVPIIGENPLGSPEEQARATGIPLERFSPAVPFQIAGTVTTDAAMKNLRQWISTLSAAERGLVRDHFESEGGFDDSERGREFLSIIRGVT